MDPRLTKVCFSCSLNMYLSGFNENRVIFEVIFYNFVQISSPEEILGKFQHFFKYQYFQKDPSEKKTLIKRIKTIVFI